MKKIIMLMIVTVFLTGCTVQYNLNIDNDTITEDIDVQVAKSSLDDYMYNELTKKNNKVYLNDEKYYNVKYEENGGILKLHYNYTHDIQEFKNSRTLDWCYHDTRVINDDNKIQIEATGAFDCANTTSNTAIENTTINITTDLKVLENNADKVNDNTYTWSINKDNYTNKPIKITMQKKADIKNVAKNIGKNIEKNSASKDLFIIYGGIALLLILVILLVSIKLKKNNEI